MTLQGFVEAKMDDILGEWEAFASSLPACEHMDPAELRDHARYILERVICDMQHAEGRAEQEKKSKGRQERSLQSKRPAHIHAEERLIEGFNLNELVSEYRALRASVVRLWTQDMGHVDKDSLYEFTRFNEAIDQALTDAIERFTEQLDRSRQLFLGVLGHDIRTPLGVISTSADYLLATDKLPANETKVVVRISQSCQRISQLVSDLLDVTRTKLGGALPVEKRPMDLGETAEQTVQEIRAYYPHDTVQLELEGDLRGVWDKSRLYQLLVNLLKNAIEHGREGTPVTVKVCDKEKVVLLEVHNEGMEIPSIQLKRIFEPLITAQNKNREARNAGLGLYIVQTIVQAHKGTTQVESSSEKGTIFKICLPKGEL